jgi:selenium metabolism protein YedF
MQEIDCRGLDCPAPVIATKKGIEEHSGSSFRVLLDKGAARENVLRFCASKRCTVFEEMGDENTSLTITCQLEPSVNECFDNSLLSKVILISSDKLGSGSDELGKLLMKNFIITLLELQKQPEKIIFVNSGVLLTSAGSELLEPLTKLSNAGVEILSCGICLDYYGIREKLAAGAVSNMYTIAESMLLSGDTIKL